MATVRKTTKPRGEAKTASLHVHIPTELHSELGELSRRTDVPMTKIVVRALRDFLKAEKAQEKKGGAS